MIILGIDPGLATLGYGVIQAEGAKQRCIHYGVLTTPAGASMPDRLRTIAVGIDTLIETWEPEQIAFEELFFGKNVKTAIAVGQARGAALATAARRCTELYEYTPMQVKQAVTGYGLADKQQVQHMVRLILGLAETPKPDDAADGLAIAICHAQMCRMSSYNRM